MPLNYKLIGDNIKRLRKAQHVTQQKMADDLYLSLSLISKLERGVKAVSLETFCSIADYLNSSIAELTADPNEPEVQHNHMIHEINAILEQMDNRHLKFVNSLMKTYAALIQDEYEFPNPDVPAKNKSVKNPDVPANNPDKPAKNPDESDESAKNPDVLTKNPDVPANNPDESANNPDVPANNPDASVKEDT